MKKFLLLFIDKSFSFSPKKPFQIVKFLLAEGVEFLLIRNFTRLRRKQNFSFATRVFKNIKQFMFLKYPSNPFHHITTKPLFLEWFCCDGGRGGI